jgi:hypothetical protein
MRRAFFVAVDDRQSRSAGGGMTVSAWWVFWAFLGGGCAGILLMALMFVASAEEDRMEPLLKGPERPEEAPGLA